MRLDLHDVLALVGTTLIGAGLWMVYPPAALIVIGVVLVLVGISGRPASRPRTEGSS